MLMQGYSVDLLSFFHLFIVLLEILEDYSRNVQKNTRRDHIVTDLLENNIFEHIPAKRREQIKVALKRYIRRYILMVIMQSRKSMLQPFFSILMNIKRKKSSTFFLFSRCK